MGNSKKNRRLGIGGPEQVAELLGVHPFTARRWCREGRIPAFKVGPRLWRVDLDALMDQMTAAK